jgi:hypothetical protein
MVKLLFRHDFEVDLVYQEDYHMFDMDNIKFEQQLEELKRNGILSVSLLRY